MLKQHKNALLDSIKTVGLDAGLFTGEEVKPISHDELKPKTRSFIEGLIEIFKPPKDFVAPFGPDEAEPFFVVRLKETFRSFCRRSKCGLRSGLLDLLRKNKCPISGCSWRVTS